MDLLILIGERHKSPSCTVCVSEFSEISQEIQREFFETPISKHNYMIEIMIDNSI